MVKFYNFKSKFFKRVFYKIEYLYWRFFHSKPKLNINNIQKCFLVFGNDDFKDVGKNYYDLFPDQFNDKIIQANLICEHVFDLLGSGPCKLSHEGKGYQSINWHSDFKSNYKWDPKIFFCNILCNQIEGVDIKVPWELSRFQHLNILGQTYLITKDDKYLYEFINQITDWIDNNPVGFGVNWVDTMDIAIRVANWLVSIEFFLKRDNLPKDFLYKFYSSIYEHGKFIRLHLIRLKNKTNENHYISSLAGLFFISVYCPFFKESNNWLNFCIKELTKEIDKQVYKDGCDFEASTSYHRLVLEIFFYCNLLADCIGISFPKVYKDKVRKMFEVSLFCIKPDGCVPQIGDNDSGRFLVFAKKPILEHKYLLILASIYYEDSFFKLTFINFNEDEEAFWIFGKQGKKTFDNLPLRLKSLPSKSFPDSGWFIIRQNNDYCFISCGPNGQNGNGGHAHNDKLSFELMINNQDIIVDPGSFVYTPYTKERNKFRSTSYHNTISFDNCEQNTIPDSLFSLPSSVLIDNINLKESNKEVVFEGEIQYNGITHKRVITLFKKSNVWHIRDILSSTKKLKGKLIFHLHPEVFYDDEYILLRKSNKRLASIELVDFKFSKGDYEYSPEYGVKIKADYLSAEISAEKKIEEVNIYIRKI